METTITRFLFSKKMPPGTTGKKTNYPLDFSGGCGIYIDDATGVGQCQETLTSGVIAVVN